MKSILAASVLFASVSYAHANSRLECKSDVSRSSKSITVIVDQYINDPIHGTVNEASVQDFDEAPVLFTPLRYVTKNNFGVISRGFILGTEFALTQVKDEGVISDQWNLRVPSMNIRNEPMVCN